MRSACSKPITEIADKQQSIQLNFKVKKLTCINPPESEFLEEVDFQLLQ